ncbi:hypothetical protein ACHAWF_013865 [Thalassiosira exigua]
MSHSPIPYDTQQGYNHLLMYCYNIDPETGAPIKPKCNTNKGHQLDDTNNLHEAVARLADGEAVLQHNIKILQSSNSTKTEKSAAANAIKKLAPLLSIATKISSEAANVVSPIAGTKVAHQRMQTMRAKQMRSENKEAANESRLKSKAVMIDAFVQSEGLPESELSPPKGVSTKAAMPRRSNRKTLHLSIPSPPEPAKGKASYAKMREKGFVPVSDASVYRLYDAHERGVRFAFDQPWHATGRPLRIEDSRLKECAKQLANCQGRKELTTKVKRKGLMPETGKKINPTTINNYTALFVGMDKRLTITDQSIDKTNNRHTTENSLIEAMCFLCVIAMAHFYDKPVRVRPSIGVLYGDDTTEYAINGLQSELSHKVGTVSKTSLASKGSRSTYHVDPSRRMNGRRIKRHFISNANGDSAPAVYVIMCSKSEMPKDDVDFIVWKIPGLCVGGYGVGGSKAPGYILFIRKGADEIGAEKKIFRWIRDNILFPYISVIRKAHGFDDTKGVPIPEEFIFVYWCDEITHSFTPLSVRRVCEHFNSMVLLSISMHDLKRALEEQFRREENGGRPFLKKKEVVVDYIGKQPTNLTQCHMPEKIKKGFKVNGMIVMKLEMVPVLQTIVKTCKTTPQSHHYDLIVNTLPTLMEYSYSHGMRYIDDQYLIDLGFPVSLDANGEEKVKTMGIYLECQHRAKCLAGAAEVTHCAKREEELEAQKKRREEQTKVWATQKFNEDKATVKELCNAAGQDASEANLVHCTMTHFAACNDNTLQYFIAARHPTIQSATATKYLKKPRGCVGLEEAEASITNLITVDFELRSTKSRLSVPADEIEENNESAACALAQFSLSLSVVNLDGAVEEFQPSSILSNTGLLGAMIGMIDSRDLLQKTQEFHTRPVTPKARALMDKADQLNLSVVAAYAVYFDHVKKNINIKCLGDTDCLLAKPEDNRYLVVSDQTHPLFGAYLHHDTNRDVFVRSGSAMGQGGFGRRLNEHERRAKCHRNDDNSHLYQVMPHSESIRAKSPGIDGLFDDLVPYIAAYFDDSAATRTDFSRGGVFMYTDEERAKI